MGHLFDERGQPYRTGFCVGNGEDDPRLVPMDVTDVAWTEAPIDIDVLEWNADTQTLVGRSTDSRRWTYAATFPLAPRQRPVMARVSAPVDANGSPAEEG